MNAVGSVASLNSRRPLSMDDLKKKAPSIFATRASQKMSEHYTFIPSHTVVDSLTKMGLVVVDAQQRKSSDAASARHLIRFARTADLTKMKDARKVGDVHPELVWSNSHNGRCRAKLFFGIFRLACANGLIVADKMFAGLERRHSGTLEGILDEVQEVFGHTREVIGSIEVMQQTKLNDKQRMEFANKALELRYADPETGKLMPAPITSEMLLVPRRPTDAGSDLWRTFNVVQENLMRGGIEGKSANGRKVRTREVQDVRKVLTFNTSLWSLAAERIAA